MLLDPNRTQVESPTTGIRLFVIWKRRGFKTHVLTNFAPGGGWTGVKKTPSRHLCKNGNIEL